MPRSVYSVEDRGGTPRFDPIHLVKRFAAAALVTALSLLGTATIASAGGTAATVTGVSFAPTTAAVRAGDTSAWTVTFTPSAQLAANDVVNLTFPTGTTFTASPTVTTGGGLSSFTASDTTSANTMAVTLIGTTSAVAASSTLTITSVINPPAATYATTAFAVNVNAGTPTNAGSAVTIYPAKATAIATPTVVNGGPVYVSASNTILDTATLSFMPDGSPSTVTTSYDVTASPSGPTVCANISNSTGLTAEQTCAISGLTPGVQYTFTVTPTGGNEPATANSVLYTASTTLLAPTVTPYASGTVQVGWKTDGAATLYTVTSSPTGGTCAVGQSTPSVTSLSCLITGLTNGVHYTFTLTPSGYAAGITPSGASVSASTEVGSPLAPVAVSASLTSANVSWTADGVATTYVVTSNPVTPGDLTGTCTVASSVAITGAQNCTVTGLTSGAAYTFTVTPYNNGTTTLPGTTSPATTLTSGLADPTLSGAGSQAVTASFVANGVFSTYTVEAYTASGANAADATGFTCVVTNATTPPTGLQTCTVSGLTNGTKYYFAVTRSGNGATSVTSSGAASFTVSNALSSLGTVSATTAGADAVKVSWTADGSSTLYTVQTYTAAGVLQTPSCFVANSTTPPSGAQSCTVTGLTNGVTYYFTVVPGGANVASSPSSSQLITAFDPFGGQPTAVGAGSGAVQVTFVANGTYSTYVVTSTPGSQTCTITNTTTAPSGSQNCVVTGLTNGTSYTFTVTASGNGLTSATSVASNAVTPGAAIAIPTVANAGSGAVAVTFSADGVSTLYTVNAYLVGGTVSQGSCFVGNSSTPPTGAQSCTVTGLNNGTKYTFNVTPAGNNTVSTVSAMSAAIQVTNALSQPTVVNAGSGAVTVSWTADGNATLYTVNSSPAGGLCVVGNTTTAPTGKQSCTITGLTNGVTYTFTVTPSGGSQAAPSIISPASNPILVGVSFLAAPTAAFAAVGSAAVTWTADGVASTYTVDAYAPLSSTPTAVVGTCVIANSTTPPKGSQSCDVTGLTTGTEYTFTVTPSGNGTTSLTSAPSAPYIAVAAVAPGSPTGVTTVATANTIAVTWVAPTNTGNSPITGYVVTATAGNTTTSCGTVAGTATTCTISGLSASTVYVVMVAAVNAIGTSGTASASATTLAAPVAKNPYTTGTHGVAYVGRTVTLTISGGNFYGQPKITSNNAGTRVGVKGDTGSVLTIIVTTSASARTGWHTFTITLANGKVCRANYNVK